MNQAVNQVVDQVVNQGVERDVDWVVNQVVSQDVGHPLNRVAHTVAHSVAHSVAHPVVHPAASSAFQTALGSVHLATSAAAVKSPVARYPIAFALAPLDPLRRVWITPVAASLDAPRPSITCPTAAPAAGSVTASSLAFRPADSIALVAFACRELQTNLE